MAEPLTIRFAADVDKAKAGMASLASSVASNAISIGTTLRAVNDNAARVSSTIAAMPTAFRAAAIGVGSFLALKAAIDLTSAAAQAARDRLDSLIKIGTQAQGAGVGTTFLQGWLGQAEKLRTEVATLEGMLTRAREASTVRIGEGDRGATSAIQDRLKQNVGAGNLGQGDLDRFTGAKDQEARIRVILDLIEQLQAKGAQLAAFDLANKMFGSDFEGKLRNGVGIIAEMRSALDGLTTAGGERVKTEEEIAAAQRVSEALMQAQTTLAEALLPIQQDIAHWEMQQAEALANVKVLFADIVAAAAQLYGLVVNIGNAITAIGSWSGWSKVSELSDSVLGKRNWAPGAPPIVDMTDADRAAAKTPATPLPAITAKPGDTSRALPSLSGGAGRARGGGAGASETDQIESYIRSLERSTAALKAEAETYGLSNVAKQQAIALAKGEAIAKERGTALTEGEISKIKAVASAAGEAKDRLAELQKQSAQAAEAMREFGQMGVDALADMIIEGRSFDDVMQSVVKQLARAALQGALMGTGPFAGLMGTGAAPGATGAGSTGGLFGMLAGALGSFAGGKAEGGEVPAGQWAVVGEKGPELLAAAATARNVVPNAAIPNLLAPKVEAGSNTSNVNVSPTVHITQHIAGNGDAAIAQISRQASAGAIQAYHEQLKRNIGPMVRDWKQRGG